MRISAMAAIEGSYSDPRNSTMLKMLSLVKLGERAGSGVSGIFHIWEKVYHNMPSIEEHHDDKVDRTVLILDTKGNAQDIKAMLSLYDSYDDIIGDISNIRLEQNAILSNSNGTLSGFGTQNGTLPGNDTLNGILNSDGTQSRPNGSKISHRLKIAIFIEELRDVVSSDPTISRQNLADKYGLSIRTMSRYLKMAKIQWVGATRGGKWKVSEAE